MVLDVVPVPVAVPTVPVVTWATTLLPPLCTVCTELEAVVVDVLDEVEVEELVPVEVRPDAVVPEADALEAVPSFCPVEVVPCSTWEMV